MTDREIYHKVLRESLSGDYSVANQFLVSNLDRLLALYGASFSIVGACQTLEALSSSPMVWRDELRKAKMEDRDVHTESQQRIRNR